jgi:2-polyprenyl-3-methyl-5-hydroxy-6-metoxy-1,4-benzoquinol methylase
MEKVRKETSYYTLQNSSHLNNVELYRQIKYQVLSRFDNPLIYDIGCGTGYITNFLGAVGYDINSEAIKYAKNKYKSNRFYNIDATDISLRKLKLKKADAIVCLNMLEHMKDSDREKFLDKVIPSIIKKSGVLIFSLYRQYYLLNIINMLLQRKSFFDKTHVHNWTVNKFINVINKHFEIEKVQNLAGYTKITKITSLFKTETLIFARIR